MELQAGSEGGEGTELTPCHCVPSAGDSHFGPHDAAIRKAALHSSQCRRLNAPHHE